MTTLDKQLYRLRDVQYASLISFDDSDCDNDSALILDWANDPLAREMSFNQELIDWGEHWTWFNNRVEEGNWWILEQFNGYEDTVPIGQVRFDKRVGVLGIPDGCAASVRLHEYFIVSIFIAEEFRRGGFATQLLRLGLARVESKEQKLPCVAYIKGENKASICLFRGMAFANSFNIKGRNYTTVDGDDYITLVRYRE